MPAMQSSIAVMPLIPENLPIAVEQWDADENHVEEVLARSMNSIIARAAFASACDLRPDRIILLRDRTRVIARSSEPADITVEIDALPKRLRDYIYRLKVAVDPQGIIQDNFRLREQNAALIADIARLK